MRTALVAGALAALAAGAVLAVLPEDRAPRSPIPSIDLGVQPAATPAPTSAAPSPTTPPSAAPPSSSRTT